MTATVTAATHIPRATHRRWKILAGVLAGCVVLLIAVLAFAPWRPRFERPPIHPVIRGYALGMPREEVRAKLEQERCKKEDEEGVVKCVYPPKSSISLFAFYFAEEVDKKPLFGIEYDFATGQSCSGILRDMFSAFKVAPPSCPEDFQAQSWNLTDQVVLNMARTYGAYCPGTNCFLYKLQIWDWSIYTPRICLGEQCPKPAVNGLLSPRR